MVKRHRNDKAQNAIQNNEKTKGKHFSRLKENKSELPYMSGICVCCVEPSSPLTFNMGEVIGEGCR